MAEKIRILLLENVAADAEMNIRALKNEGLDFEAALTTNRAEFEKALTEFRPDMILADYRLPNFTGIDALRIVQERKVAAPVIIVTGSLDEETAVDTIKEGATDYVIKQHLVRLGPAIRSALEKKRLAAEKEKAQQALREAYRDLELKVKQRTAELADSEATLDALISSSPVGIVVIDDMFRYIRINDKAAQDLGRPGEEILGKKVEEVKPPRLYQPLIDEFEETLRTGRPFLNREISGPDPRAAHETRYWISSHFAIPLPGGRRGIGMITVDITERKKAEDTLRRNEYELRTMVDNSPDLIFRLNRQLQYVYVNPAYERLTGILKDKFTGRTNSELGMTPQMVEFWRSAVQGAMESGRELSAEFDMSGFFGKRYFFARVIPEFDKSGLVETVLVIARDITGRMRAEEQIRFISFHDGVTGLFNRVFFEEELRRVDTERNLPISIIMGDINNLKLANELFGHNEGDTLLKAVADSLRKACRQSDVVARWGGDEFAVILPKTELATAEIFCSRIEQLTGENRGTALPASIAVGAAAKEQRDRNIYQTVRQAEQFMYDYKLVHAPENEKKVLSALLALARTQDGDHELHIERSNELAHAFSEALKLSEDQQKALYLLVRLHDIGDSIIPREILMKQGPLSVDEWKIVKKHAEAGLKIVRTFADTARISEEIFAHHEHWDGSGYPKGLKGREIPYLARLFLIVDAFDVMTHSRPYARTLSQAEAVEELRSSAGRQFDPELTERFIAVLSPAEAVLPGG